MSSEFEQNLEKYVDVILKVGVNLQKGQRLLIAPAVGFGSLPLELAPFVEKIVRKAYIMGARFVEVMWDDPQIHLIRFKYAPRDSFDEISTWGRDATLEFLKKGDAILGIYAINPDLFIEQDPELLAVVQSTLVKYYKKVSELIIKMATNWSGISAPVDGWTEKVFPNLPPDKGKTKFWDTIFDICRVNQDDPVSSWNDHIKQLNRRINYLNKKQYATLKLKATRTELKIGLPEEHNWISGRVKSQNGIDFTLNLPTEEIATTPHRDKTEGIVSVTKPLYISGTLIEDFKLKFSKGEVVEVIGGKGKEFLDNIIKIDEGARRLGEVALVPHNSPISQSGLLFYNSLIDENAACHLALGNAYRNCFKDGEKMSDEEFKNAGGNISLIHIDFMIGSGEMDIDGITEDGTAEAIMRKGEWAFEV
ncbi:MAG: aminopeptidase [Promethearchaeota archaeon]